MWPSKWLMWNSFWAFFVLSFKQKTWYDYPYMKMNLEKKVYTVGKPYVEYFSTIKDWSLYQETHTLSLVDKVVKFKVSLASTKTEPRCNKTKLGEDQNLSFSLSFLFFTFLYHSLSIFHPLSCQKNRKRILQKVIKIPYFLWPWQD